MTKQPLYFIPMSEFDSHTVTTTLEKWHNTPLFQKSYAWNPSEIDVGVFQDGKNIWKNYLNEEDKEENKTHYFISESETNSGDLWGEIILNYNKSLLLKQEEQSDGVLVHCYLMEEDQAKAKKKFERLILSLENFLATDATSLLVEFSFFEHNYNYCNWPKELHYHEVGRIPKMTFKNGKMWGEVRLQKKLKK